MKNAKFLPYALLVLLIGVYFVVFYDPLSANVVGKVYWNDEVLTLEQSQRGEVVFRPVEGGPNCTGVIDADGNYSLGTGSRAGIFPGDYLISISVVEFMESDDPSALPAGYRVTPNEFASPLTSGLTCMVKGGENVHDIHIKGVASSPPVSSDLLADKGSSEVDKSLVSESTNDQSEQEDNSSADAEVVSNSDAMAEQESLPEVEEPKVEEPKVEEPKVEEKVQE